MILGVRVEDKRFILEPREVLVILAELSLSIWLGAIDLLPLRSIDIGQFIWSRADNRTVLIMQFQEVSRCSSVEVRRCHP